MTNREWPEADKRLADQMASYWVNFARNGDPNGAGLPAWPKYKDTKSGQAMILGDTVELEAPWDFVRLALFEGLYTKQVVGSTRRTN